DASGNSSTASQTINVVDTTPPTAAITGPTSGTIVAAGTSVTFTGSVGDNCGLGSAQWMLDAITLPATIGAGRPISTAATLSAAGVYQVKLTATDACGNSTTASQTPDGFDWTIIVYDPNAGFVTGGGWIDSPAGAYRANQSLAGKATFGFVSKYQKGAKVPTGETQFQFRLADLNFHSSVYEWLVVSGALAQYKGSGTVNGSGDYGVLLTAIDGALLTGGPDKFRMKIWDKSTSAIAYDNQYGQSDGSDASTALGGGSVVIYGYTGGKTSMTSAGPASTQELDRPAALPLEYGLSQNSPNPFGVSTTISFALPERSRVRLAIYDLQGREVRTLLDGDAEAGWRTAAWRGEDDGGRPVEAGIYFVRMTARSLTSTRSAVALR